MNFTYDLLAECGRVNGSAVTEKVGTPWKSKYLYLPGKEDEQV
jgi:hypothetical protein